MEQGYEQREERKAAFYESLQAVVHILKFMEECTYEDIDFDMHPVLRMSRSQPSFRQIWQTSAST